MAPRNVTLSETNCDWLFDMSVKWPHGWALTNECSHIFQTFSRQSELKVWLREATGGPVLARGPPDADHWQIYWLLCEWPSYFIMHCSRTDRYLSGYSYICWLQCTELTFVTMPKFIHAPPLFLLHFQGTSASTNIIQTYLKYYICV